MLACRARGVRADQKFSWHETELAIGRLIADVSLVLSGDHGHRSGAT